MKIILFTVIALVVAGLSLRTLVASSGNPARVSLKKDSSQADSASGVAVVELFTSEGCSSCPSADALLESLNADKKGAVYVLSFHVDYWNSLGWKDAFSKAEWTARQRHYVDRLHLESAYTPQAVVNGQEEFVGSNKSRLYTAVDHALHRASSGNLRLTSKLEDGRIRVSFSTLQKNATVNLVLVQKEASSQVQRGENSGRKLHHINVVRDFQKAEADGGSGEIFFRIPQGSEARDFKVIGFLQEDASDRIVGATEAAIL